jgi:hypothetical protein
MSTAAGETTVNVDLQASEAYEKSLRRRLLTIKQQLSRIYLHGTLMNPDVQKYCDNFNCRNAVHDL